MGRAAGCVAGAGALRLMMTRKIVTTAMNNYRSVEIDRALSHAGTIAAVCVRQSREILSAPTNFPVGQHSEPARQACAVVGENPTGESTFVPPPSAFDLLTGQPGMRWHFITGEGRA
jgi:hypothetical protein